MPYVRKRLPERWSSRLVLATSAFVAFLVFGMAILIVWSNRETVLESWRDRASTNASMVAAHANQTIIAADLVLQSIVEKFEQAEVHSDAEFRDFAKTESFFQMLAERANVLPQVDVLTAAAVDGTVINFSRSYPAPSINLGDRDYFKAHLADPTLDFHISEPVQNRGNGKWTFYLTRKVLDADRKLVGLVLVGIKVDFFKDYYADTSVGTGYTTSLLRSDGILLARHPERAIGKSFTGGQSFREPLESRGKNVSYTTAPRVSDPQDQSGRLVATNRMWNLPLVISISVTDALLFRNWNQFAVAAMVIAGIIYVILLILILQFARQQQEKARSIETIGQLNQELVQLNKSLEQKVNLRTRALAAANQSLRRMASTDPLTGIANRRTFDLRIKNELALFMRHDVPFALLLVDIDHFKAINDSQGHEEGDVVLRELGSLLRKETRSSDLAARLGGEEFGIVLSKCDAGEELDFAERLNETIRNHLFGGMRITVTIGIAFAEVGDTETTIYRRADDALYMGKTSGRDRAVLARPSDTFESAAASK